MAQFGYQTLGFGSGTSDSGAPIPAWGGTRMMYAGGYDGSTSIDVIESKTVASTSACTDYGDLTTARSRHASCSNQTYMYTCGGLEADNDRTNTIARKVFASDADATSYGTFESDVIYMQGSGVSDGTRGCWGGGRSGSGGEGTVVDHIRFMNLATEAYTRTMSNLTADKYSHQGHDGDTYGYWFGGYDSSSAKLKTIDYITIATTSYPDAGDFGDLSEELTEAATVGSQVRIIHGGGSKASNYTTSTMEYMTVGTSGSTTTYGYLDVPMYQMAGAGDATKGEFIGGWSQWAGNNKWTRHFTIATTSNSTTNSCLTANRTQGDASTGI